MGFSFFLTLLQRAKRLTQNCLVEIAASGCPTKIIVKKVSAWQQIAPNPLNIAFVFSMTMKKSNNGIWRLLAQIRSVLTFVRFMMRRRAIAPPFVPITNLNLAQFSHKLPRVVRIKGAKATPVANAILFENAPSRTEFAKTNRLQNYFVEI